MGRKCMQSRQVKCLDSYLDAQKLMIGPRLFVVLDENVKSIRKACQQNLPPIANTHPTHPHLVTRRYAELAASLYALSSPDSSGGLTDTIQQKLIMMQSELVALCKALSTKLESAEAGLVFLVNNYDLVLSIFHERHLPRSATASFEQLLREQVQLFVENQLSRHFPDLVTFVKTTEPIVAHIDDAAARQSAAMGPPAGVNVQKMEQVVRGFSAVWKTETERIHQYVMTSFSNFSNGMEILKQVLTQLLLYYTRLQKVMAKSFPQQPPAFAHELVPSTTILTEIKQYSRSF